MEPPRSKTEEGKGKGKGSTYSVSFYHLTLLKIPLLFPVCSVIMCLCLRLPICDCQSLNFAEEGERGNDLSLFRHFTSAWRAFQILGLHVTCSTRLNCLYSYQYRLFLLLSTLLEVSLGGENEASSHYSLILILAPNVFMHLSCGNNNNHVFHLEKDNLA